MQKLLRNEMSGSMIRLELKSDGNDSDSEIRRVPEMRGKSPTPGTGQTSSQTSTPPKRRGSGSVDKEGKRLKRLLRNRVSAQQARERKKAYVSDLESRVKELEQRNAELEEKAATLGKENHMLCQIVKNTALHKNSGSPATDLVVEKVDH